VGHGGDFLPLADLSQPVGSFRLLRCCGSRLFSAISCLCGFKTFWLFFVDLFIYFKEMDFAHLERLIPKMEQDVYDLVLLHWGKFQFLPRNCLSQGLFEEMIDSLFLQNTQIAQLYKIRKY
jgi:hypothetical protein